MRLTKKRNGKNVIPLLNAVCGIDMPYWGIDRADNLHSYLVIQQTSWLPTRTPRNMDDW